ncbi:MAG: protein kinase [Chloroflexota bacterium]
MAGETILNGRYQLVAQQGSGGMSVIYKAVDRALGRTVAVKILRPSLTSDPSFLEKFRAEARAVANLSHPNIVTVFDVGSEGPTHYIVMELVEGTDLKKIIKQTGAQPVDRAVDLAIDICAGLGYAHRSGLVHADVKPQNVLVTPQFEVKVTDFGIAQALTDTQPQQRAEVVWGSPHYFAPEQARGEAPTPQADVYAVGVVLFELLTGELPYAGASQQDLAMAHIKEPIPNLHDYRPGIPDRLAKMVYKAMAKKPEGRFRNADQLGNVLTSYRDSAQGNTAVAPQVPSQPKQPPSQATVPSNRPPGIGGQPRTTNEPPKNSEVTARYSAAPNAQNLYDPRNAQSQSAQNYPQAPQSFEQRYSVPAPQGQQNQQGYYPQQPAPDNYPQPQTMSPMAGDSARFASQQSQPYSQNMPYVNDEEGMDMVTISLGVLALIAVSGLVILWIIVIATI